LAFRGSRHRAKDCIHDSGTNQYFVLLKTRLKNMQVATEPKMGAGETRRAIEATDKALPA
jgi:hypothetical protein